MLDQIPVNKREAMRIMHVWPKVYSASLSARTRLATEGFGCGPGWYPLIDRLSADINAILERGLLSGFCVLQVQEKFGGLRVAVTGSNERILARIAAAQVEATHTCEGCGCPSRIRTIDMWLTTRCNHCAAQVQVQVRPR